ncbi:putative lipoprotein, partial [Yersinia pestis PY-07]
MRRVLL